jgi:hypothetical protein
MSFTNPMGHKMLSNDDRMRVNNRYRKSIAALVVSVVVIFLPD